MLFCVGAFAFVRTGAAGELVKVVAGIAKQRHQLPQLRKVELHHISVNRHLAEIRCHVGGAELRHLRFNHFSFLRRDAEFELNIPFALCHRSALRGFGLRRNFRRSCFRQLFQYIPDRGFLPLLRVGFAGLAEQVKGSNKKILKTVMDESEDTIRSYMEMLHADLPFVRYSDCMAKIKAVKHASTRKNMRLLVEKLSDCKSYAQAVKNSELSESQLRTARKQFEKLGIQPIT